MTRKQIIAALKARQLEFDEKAPLAELNKVLRLSWLTVRNSMEPEYEAGDEYDFEMTIHGQIGTDWYGDEGYSAKQFQDELKPFHGKRGLLCLHTQGGNLWDGFAIAEMVRNHGLMDTKILGIAASSGDVIFQAGRERIMPMASMRMGHNPKAMFIAAGSAEDLRTQKADYDKTIDRLDKHANTLAEMYARVSGNKVEDCRQMMNAEEFMDGEESLHKGFCDRCTEDVPVHDALDLSHFKRTPAKILNMFSAPKGGQPNPNPTQGTIVNKKQKIALLNLWGVNLPTGKTEDSITDEWLDGEIAKGKPQWKPNREMNLNLLRVWNVTVPDNSTDEQIEALVCKGKPQATNPNPAIVNLDDHPVVKEMRANAARVRRETLRNEILALAGTDGGMRIPLNSVDGWVDDAVSATDDPVKGNPVVNRLKSLEPKSIGMAPLAAIEIGDSTEYKDLAKFVQNALAPRNAMLQLRASTADERLQKDLAASSKTIGRTIGKVIDSITKNVRENDMQKRREVIAAYLDSMPIMNDQQNGPYGSVTVSSDLQRQVIMSETMRAFKRRLVPLTCFSHNFNSVPLQGTDVIDVPYYPLNTNVSQRFVAPGAAGGVAGISGYQFVNGNDQAMRKTLTVGGSGPANKVPGIDRAYQALTYSAYLLRRQPWVDIQRLAVMRVEQLAFDILNDIITSWILKANFGNAVWVGAPAGFDETTVAYLQGVANKVDWPEAMRNLVIGTDYYTNLASSPYVKAFLNIGDTNTIREGRIGGLYGFEDTIGNPRIPQTGDGNLVGWISYPSSILVATSPILPAPGEMKLMVSYDLVVDDQIGLAFEYKYWGEPWNSADREIIECNYGSGLGELAALKRLVAAGQ